MKNIIPKKLKRIPIIDEEEDGKWETILDFTKEGGIEIEELISRLEKFEKNY